MTCIVGIADGTTVWIGADSFLGGSDVQRQTALPKIVRVGDLLFGCAGSVRGTQIVQYHWTPPEPEDGTDTDTYVIRDVSESLRACFSAHGCSKSEQGVEALGDDFYALIGFAGHLFRFTHRFCMIRYAEGVDAIGAGFQYALGSLYQTRRVHDPRRRVLDALAASAAYSPWVEKPFIVATLPL